MIEVLCYERGHERVGSARAVDPRWLRERERFVVWVDLCEPSPDEVGLLRDPFDFHELAIEDALTPNHPPKLESYDGYLYLVLHGIDFAAAEERFATMDADFFIGPNYLVTVRHHVSRSVPYVLDLCRRGGAHLMQEGPFGLAHRVIDKMVEHYRPEVDALTDQIDEVENSVFGAPQPEAARAMLGLKRDVAALRRVVIPQRDLVNRLARREYPALSESIAYRFRDVYDDLVRLTDEALYFQDRISGLLEVHLADTSNRLNEVMKVLTLIATVFMPLTVLTGIYGMNIELPQFPGGPGAQFWWLLGMMGVTTGGMLWFFRTRRWL